MPDLTFHNNISFRFSNFVNCFIRNFYRHRLNYFTWLEHPMHILFSMVVFVGCWLFILFYVTQFRRNYIWVSFVRTKITKFSIKNQLANELKSYTDQLFRKSKLGRSYARTKQLITVQLQLVS